MAYDITKGNCRAESAVCGEKFRITVLTSRLLRLEYSESGIFEDRPTVFAINRFFDAPEFSVRERDGRIELQTEHLTLFYDKGPFSPGGLQIKVRSECCGIYCTWHFSDVLTENLRGTARTLDQADGEIPLENGIQSRLQGYSLLDDSVSPLLTEDGGIARRESGETDLYFFGYGYAYQEALCDYFRLSGSTPLLPRFALGNWWSRFHPYTSAEYLALMDRFAEEKIPLSVAVIDMDWHLTEIPAHQGRGWTGYTWNRALIPEPAGFLEALHQRRLKVTLNLHPAEGIQPHEEQYDAAARLLGMDPSVRQDIPFDFCSRDFVRVYFDCLLKPREAEGVDFWWIDWQQGSHSRIAGADPLWLLNHFHFLNSSKGGKRPLILSRYAGPGSHRYPVGFSGDTVISWKSLHFQPYFTATAANIGYGWWSHDIGGHCGGVRDEELMVRWVQFGVFSPIMRLHSTSNLFNGKEPWNFSESTGKIMKSFLQLRHRLIPYLYTMNYLASAKGILPVRPMYYLHPRCSGAYEVPNQYYFGDALIVCPVTAPSAPDTGLGSVTAWLPEGTYYDVFSGQRYAGNGMQTLYRPISRIPVLAKAGAIIPLASEEDILQNGTDLPQKLDIQVFCGQGGDYELYEDDGVSCEYQKHSVTRISIRWDEDISLQLRIEPDADPYKIRPEKRSYTVTFVGIENSDRIHVSAKGAIRYSKRYDSRKKALTVELSEDTGGDALSVCIDRPKLADIDRKDSLFNLLQRFRIGYELKERVFRCITEKADSRSAFPELLTMKLSADVLGALSELIFT